YPDDLLLVVEISRSTLKYDLTRKRELYARAAILEYWVVDLTGQKLEVFRQSDGENYQENFTLTDGVIAPQAYPNCTVQVAEIFP
ncbi:MAG: Uma2 family endonuclease, partial [Cyanobacteria bacterium P01_H01_bin.130]